MMKTQINYSFDDETEVQIAIESQRKIFKSMIEDMQFVLTNNICIVITREECFEMSEYFLMLSQELNKLRELG